LVDHGISGFDYICGTRGSRADGTWTTHAWLHRDGLIIDITADQFEDGPGAVLIVEDSTWHDAFDWDRPSTGDFREWHGPGAFDLHGPYQAVVSAIAELRIARGERGVQRPGYGV
jgi:hypothetical protein